MQNLHQYHSIAKAITALLHPYGEVVIHDLKSGKIAAIFNPFSKRKVGDESLIDDLTGEFPDVFPVYTKMNWDGKTIKSCTATLRDNKGKPVALLCMNLDISKWEEMRHLLEGWLGSYQSIPEVLFKDDWREKINMYVSAYLKNEGTSLKELPKEKKQALVKALYAEGAFEAKHAASYVGDILKLSRATIYNYLKVI